MIRFKNGVNPFYSFNSMRVLNHVPEMLVLLAFRLHGSFNSMSCCKVKSAEISLIHRRFITCHCDRSSNNWEQNSWRCSHPGLRLHSGGVQKTRDETRKLPLFSLIQSLIRSFTQPPSMTSTTSDTASSTYSVPSKDQKQEWAK